MSKDSCKIYYDGECYVCSTEINAFKKSSAADSLSYVDITDKNFHPETEGLDANELQRALHVRTAEGRILRGVDAFREIWRVVPEMRWAYWISSFWIVKILLRIGYFFFARLRRFLPKKRKTGPS